MIVAITGIILILFVIGHLLGNLQIFIGPDWINGYSQHLRDLDVAVLVDVVKLIERRNQPCAHRASVVGAERKG